GGAHRHGTDPAHRDLLGRPNVHRLVDADHAGPHQRHGDRFVLTHGFRTVRSDGDGLVAADLLGAIHSDGDRLVVVDRLGAVVLDVGRLVVVDDLGAVVPDPVGLVVFDFDVLVLLGVDEELLRAHLVLEADLVEVGRRSPLAATGLDAGLGHVGGQV